MESVVVATDDPGFDCQQWVELALRTLCRAGYLTAEQYNSGLDGMIAANMEAGNELMAE